MWKATSRQGRSIIEACAARSFMLRTAESVKTHGVIRTSALSAKLLFGRRMRPGESLAGMTRHRGNGAAPTNGMCPTRTVRNKRNRNILPNLGLIWVNELMMANDSICLFLGFVYTELDL